MNKGIRKLLLAGVAAMVASPGIAADVTAERLTNADKEPHNWLMNHRTYDAQRYSPLEKINKGNIKNLKLAYAVAIGGTSANENLQATPLAEDGYLYIVDQWGVVYKIDARSGDMGRIVWRMDPGQEKLPLSNRGAALWGNLVISSANYPPRIIATNKDNGKVVWETNLSDGQPDLQLTAAPLAVRDKIIVGAAGGDRGVRDFIAALDGATGKMIWRKYVIPAPGEPGSETWKDKDQVAWQTGGGAMWVTGTYDTTTNQVIWGTGNPVPMFDATYRPGDNLYTNSVISWDPDAGKMNWYFQYTPGDHWDYDEAGTHILVDGVVDGQSRKLITHSARNGYLYTMERNNGQTLLVKPYLENINWTKGIDPKTGKPLDYDPSKDIQTYAALPRRCRTVRPRRCARVLPAATISGPRPTARRPSCSTFQPQHPASTSRADRTSATRPATGRAGPTSRPSDSNPILRSPTRSPARSRTTSTSPTRTTAACCRPPAASFSQASPMARSPPTTTRPWSSCGRSMSAPASTRRR